MDQLINSSKVMNSKIDFIIQLAKIDESNAANCYDLFQMGYRKNGVYKIDPELNNQSVEAYCEMTKGGWTRISNRIDGGLFNKSMIEYINGFGDINSNHWLGLENIRKLTNQQKMSVRIELFNSTDDFYMIEYDYFLVGPKNDHFKLAIGNKIYGSLISKFHLHNGMKFSTYDQDNDLDSSRNCAENFGNGWWYLDCFSAAINSISPGQWCMDLEDCCNKNYKNFLYAKMMIRPSNVYH